MLNIDLNNSTTLVIGGARGIGASVVRTIADAGGGKIAWTYLNSETDINASKQLEIETSNKTETMHAPVDCTDDAGTSEFINKILDKWGAIDNLVYCAGFTSPVPFEALDVGAWRKNVDINLTGAYIVTSKIVPIMKKQKKGSIVIIGSAAVASGGGGRADYVSAKAGLEGLSKAITKEFAPCGIRCNIVHPSLIETDLLKHRHPDNGKRESLGKQVPLRRLGQPEDIANTAVFLLSDISSYITAQSIYVDGGRTFCG